MFWLIHLVLIFIAPPMLILSVPLHILCACFGGSAKRSSNAIVEATERQTAEMKLLRETIAKQDTSKHFRGGMAE